MGQRSSQTSDFSMSNAVNIIEKPPWFLAWKYSHIFYVCNGPYNFISIWNKNYLLIGLPKWVKSHSSTTAKWCNRHHYLTFWMNCTVTQKTSLNNIRLKIFTDLTPFITSSKPELGKLGIWLNRVSQTQVLINTKMKMLIKKPSFPKLGFWWRDNRKLNWYLFKDIFGGTVQFNQKLVSEF